MKKNLLFWLAFFVILLALSIAAFFVAKALNVPVALSSAISVFIFIGISAKALVNGWVVVNERWEFIIEIFGAYIGEPLKPGIYMLFPWFGFIVIRREVFLGDQMMELYLDENVEKGFGGGDVEFEDCSSSITAYLYFRITDSRAVTYTVYKWSKSLEEKTDSLLRSFMGLYKLEEVIKMKNNFCLPAIAMLTDFCPDPALTPAELESIKTKNQADWTSSGFFKSLEAWGILPIDLVISDINLTEELKQKRQMILAAEKDRDVAKIMLEKAETEKKITVKQAEAKRESAILLAEGKKKSLALEGEGEAQMLKEIATAMPHGKVPGFVINSRKWEAIKENPNATIIDGSNLALQGSQFGAGMNSQNRNKKTNE